MEKIEAEEYEALLERLDKYSNGDYEDEQELLNDALLGYYAEEQGDLDSEGIKGAKFVWLRDGRRIAYDWNNHFWTRYDVPLDAEIVETVAEHTNELLSFTQNLEDEEAHKFVELYVKALNKGRKANYLSGIPRVLFEISIGTEDRRFR